jgi:hypothetical protein
MPRADAVGSPLVNGLHRYWRDRCEGGRPMPRARLNPAEIGPYLPHLLLSQIHRDPTRVKYLVVGTQIVRVCGMDFTGRWLDEIMFASLEPEDWVSYYESMVRDEQPVFGETREHLLDGRRFAFEWVLLPLLGTGGEVAFCLSIEDHAAIRDADRESIVPAVVRKPG